MSLMNESAQSRQILAVLMAIVTLGCFEAHRQSPKPPVIEQQAKRLQAEKSFADVLVPVYSAPQILLGIVEMKGDEQVQPDGLVELGKGSLIVICRAQVIAGGKGVLGIKAGTQSLWRCGCVDDLLHLLEAVPEVRPLTSGDLDGELGRVAGAGFVHLVERLGNGGDPGSFARADMRARMSDKISNAQGFAAFHLVNQAVHRLLPQGFIRRSEVVQVRVMGDDSAKTSPAFCRMEGRDFIFTQRLARPLARGFGKKLHRVTADLLAQEQSFVCPTSNRHMRAQQWPLQR